MRVYGIALLHETVITWHVLVVGLSPGFIYGINAQLHLGVFDSELQEIQFLLKQRLAFQAPYRMSLFAYQVVSDGSD